MESSHARLPQDVSAAVQLPEAVLALVLQHLPLQQRLGACALVSRSWAAAAAASTTSIDTTIQGVDSKPKCKSLIRWLQQHGQRLTSIKAVQPSSTQDPETGIPCSWKRDSDSEGSDGYMEVDNPLRTCSMQPAPTGDVPSSAAAAAGEEGAPSGSAGAQGPLLPHLQELQLTRCRPTVSTFTLLPSLSTLTRVHFHDVDYSYLTQNRPPAECILSNNIMPQILQQLTLLQSLQITGNLYGSAGLRDKALEGLSSLQRLQRLKLEVPWDLDHSIFGRLPPSLTDLDLEGAVEESDDSYWLDIRDQPLFLQGLTNLQHLQLQSIMIPTSRLTVLTSALTCLHVENVVAEPRTDGLGLLRVLTELKSLLHLSTAKNFWGAPWPPQVFSALTAASGLTALDIWDVSEQPLPHGALQYMLPAGKQLPQLQVLRVISDQSFYHQDQLQKTFRGTSPPWCIDGKDIARIAESCTGLRKLELRHVVKRDVQVGCLADLPCSLRTLLLAGAAFRTAAANSVARLKGLQHLEWSDSPLTNAGLKQMTALTALTRLRVVRCPKLTMKVAPITRWQEWSISEHPESGALQDTRTQDTGHQGDGPDVWRQLQQLFGDTQHSRGDAGEGEGSSKARREEEDTAPRQLRSRLRL